MATFLPVWFSEFPVIVVGFTEGSWVAKAVNMAIDRAVLQERTSAVDLRLHYLAVCAAALRDAVTGGPLRTAFSWNFFDANGNSSHEQEPAGDRNDFIDFWMGLVNKHLFTDPQSMAAVMNARRNRQTSEILRKAVRDTPQLQTLLKETS